MARAPLPFWNDGASALTADDGRTMRSGSRYFLRTAALTAWRTPKASASASRSPRSQPGTMRGKSPSSSPFMEGSSSMKMRRAISD